LLLCFDFFALKLHFFRLYFSTTLFLSLKAILSKAKILTGRESTHVPFLNLIYTEKGGNNIKRRDCQVQASDQLTCEKLDMSHLT